MMKIYIYIYTNQNSNKARKRARTGETSESIKTAWCQKHESAKAGRCARTGVLCVGEEGALDLLAVLGRGGGDLGVQVHGALHVRLGGLVVVLV